MAYKTGFDVVHVDAGFLDRASDHDPSVARFSFGQGNQRGVIGPY